MQTVRQFSDIGGTKLHCDTFSCLCIFVNSSDKPVSTYFHQAAVHEYLFLMIGMWHIGGYHCATHLIFKFSKIL